MADPLRHNSKLDIAEEILNWIENNPDAEKVREEIKTRLDLNDMDLYHTHDVVSRVAELIKEQEY
jgi:hypothetical protein